jgi:hypothetical protein
MAEDDPQLGVCVEQAGRHQAQRVRRGLLCEGPSRAEQPGMSIVDVRVLRKRIARVQVEREV